jgi:hypothetical protein
MSDRHFQRSAGNGPVKIDPRQDHSGASLNCLIECCLDCSRSGACEFQARARWPATCIAEGCPLENTIDDDEREGEL